MHFYVKTKKSLNSIHKSDPNEKDVMNIGNIFFTFIT